MPLLSSLSPFDLIALSLLIAAIGLLVIAAVNDIATMTIPNWVSIAIALAYPAAALAAGETPLEIGAHLACGAVIFVAGFFLFNLGVLGGGDVKVFAAAGVWTGFSSLLPFLTITFLAGGVLAGGILVMRRAVTPKPSHPAFMNRLTDRTRGVPYGVAIAVGGAWTAAQWPIAAALNS
jgi:prepilin peptidase CpaA